MDIVIRSAVAFVFLWAITRLVGRSTLGELSSFQLIMFITMGDLVQQGVTQQDFSLTGAFLAVGTMTLMTLALTMTTRWAPAARLVHGVPVVVVRDGSPDFSAMRREHLTLMDLCSAARAEGLESLAQARRVVLEANGRLTFLTK